MGVFADKEYPADIEKKWKILHPIYTAAKHSKKYRKRCRMDKDILVIKGKRYNVSELDKLPKSLKPANVTSRSNKTVFGYFGELNPLSNFYPSPFNYQDNSYHCGEQFIQMQKAELFKDNTAMRRIEQAKTGHQCKQEGQKISKFNPETWEKNAYRLCKPGIHQKFLENEVLRLLLLNKTKGKRIAECTKDTVWGCGMSIHNDNCLDTTKWTNQGIMGRLLEEIRSELAGPDLPPLPNFAGSTKSAGKQPTPIAGASSTRSEIQQIHTNQDPMEDMNTCTSSSSSDEGSTTE